MKKKPHGYNRHVTRVYLLAAALLLAACSKNIQTTEAVRDGVMDRLNTMAAKAGLDMSTMQVDVPAVTFDRDHARATVTFKPKNSDAPPLELVYNLERKGNKWVVEGDPQSSGSPHGEGAGNPGAKGGTQLPPGHPAVGSTPGGATPLPAGHPPVGTNK